jgi:hypothetical protein
MNRCLLIILMFLSGCHATPKTSAALRGDDLVSVTRISQRGHKATYELRNLSPEPIAYAHWFGEDAEPVPYCLSQDGSSKPCGTKVVLNSDDSFWIHESYLRPGQRVRFVAQPGSAMAVGVLLWVDGKERYVWSDRRA